MPDQSPPLGTVRERAFTGMNLGVLPLWLAMIVAPRSRITRVLVRRAVPLHAAYSLGYAGLLASGTIRSRSALDFRDPERLRVQLAEGDTFLAAWSHYLTFDLLVGEWIWRDALERGRTARVALVLTWLAGPVGHGVYLVQRRLSWR